MKFTILILNILLIAACSGGMIEGSGNVVTESRAVSNFSKIIINGIGDVNITQGTNLSFNITADDNIVPLVKSSVADNTLQVYLEQAVLHATQLTYDITITNLSLLEFNGTGEVTTEETLNLSALTIKNKYIGTVNLDLSVTNIQTQILNHGSVTLTGWALTNSVLLYKTGDFKGYDLKSEVCNVYSDGIGVGEVYVSNYLTVSIMSNGNVNYKGDPSTIEKNKVGNGNLINMN